MSLRDRLRSKQRRTDHYDVKIADDTAQAEALQKARQAKIKGDVKPAEAKRLQKAVDDAQAALGECYERLHLVALSPADVDALINEYVDPEGDDQQPPAFQNALIAAVVEGDMTPEEWAEEFASGRWSFGEKDALYAKCRDLSAGRPTSPLPKDFGVTRS